MKQSHMTTATNTQKNDARKGVKSIAKYSRTNDKETLQNSSRCSIHLTFNDCGLQSSPSARIHTHKVNTLFFYANANKIKLEIIYKTAKMDGMSGINRASPPLPPPSHLNKMQHPFFLRSLCSCIVFDSTTISLNLPIICSPENGMTDDSVFHKIDRSHRCGGIVCFVCARRYF